MQAELDGVDLVSISGFADTDATFSFDADWGNAAYWAPFVYDYVTANDRERRTLSQELRLLSKPGAIAGGRGDWLVGVYVLDLDEAQRSAHARHLTTIRSAVRVLARSTPRFAATTTRPTSRCSARSPSR